MRNPRRHEAEQHRRGHTDYDQEHDKPGPQFAADSSHENRLEAHLASPPLPIVMVDSRDRRHAHEPCSRT